MKKIKIITLFLAVVLLFSSLLCIPALAVSDPEIRAKGAVLVELGSGKVLYAKNENARLAPASVTKVMTVLLAALACEERGIENDLITAPEDTWFDLSEDSSTQNIMPGEEMRFIDLMYCALVSSANEACNVIAEVVGGSNSNFIKMMNDKAEELGCKNTHFINAHGLSAEGHYTSAWDMYLILREASQHTLFSRIAGTVRYTVPETNMSAARDLTNTNRLLYRDGMYFSQYCTGGKTGSTTEAGYCLAATAESEDMSYISVVLGAEAVEVEENEYEILSFTETKRLFDWGVENFGWHTVVSAGDVLGRAKVLHGDGADSVELYSSANIIDFTANDVTRDDYEVRVRMFSENRSESFEAPITSGDVLGEASVYLGGELCGTVRLMAKNGVRMQRTEYIKTRLRETLGLKWVKIGIACVVILILLYIALVIRSGVLRSRARKAAERKKNELRRQRMNAECEPTRTITRAELKHIFMQYGPASESAQPEREPIHEAEAAEEPEEPPVQEPSPKPEQTEAEAIRSLRSREKTEPAVNDAANTEKEPEDTKKPGLILRVMACVSVVVSGIGGAIRALLHPSPEVKVQRAERQAARAVFFAEKRAELKGAFSAVSAAVKRLTERNARSGENEDSSAESGKK